jgi:hypothetical protein
MPIVGIQDLRRFFTIPITFTMPHRAKQLVPDEYVYALKDDLRCVDRLIGQVHFKARKLGKTERLRWSALRPFLAGAP